MIPAIIPFQNSTFPIPYVSIDDIILETGHLFVPATPPVSDMERTVLDKGWGFRVRPGPWAFPSLWAPPRSGTRPYCGLATMWLNSWRDHGVLTVGQPRN